MVHSWTAFESNFQDFEVMEGNVSDMKGLCEVFVSYVEGNGGSQR